MKVRESGMPERAYWETLIDHCGLLDEMGLLSSPSVFEFGVGYGSFLQCLAGRAERLAGIDIDEAMVAATRARLDGQSASVEIVHGDFFDAATTIGLLPFDTCLLMNILHHEEPAALIDRARSLLARGGRIGICHWRDDIETPRGPPLHMRIGLAGCISLVRRSGMRLVTANNSVCSPHHYYVVAN